MPAETHAWPRGWTFAALAAIIATGLVIRWVVIPDSRVVFPVDAVYYEDVGRNIALGRGVVTDYVWIYARGVPASLPIPAHGYWMPGMSLFLAAWFKLAGGTMLATRLSCLFVSLGFMLVVWWVAKTMTQNDGAALLAVGLCAVNPSLLSLAGSPDASVPQGVLAAAGLLCLYKGLRGEARWLAPAGLLVGGAQLMRNDGVLLVGVVGLCVVAGLRSGTYRFRWPHLAHFLVPYALVALPWLVRNLIVFGSPSPPELKRVLFLPVYEDIFRADLSSIHLGALLAQHGGWAGVFRYDVLVFARIVEWVAANGASTLAVFAIPFLWLRRPAAGRPYLYFLGILALVYTFVVPELGIKGSFARSFLGVVPWLLASAAGGVFLLGERLAQRCRYLGQPAWVALLGVVLLSHTIWRLGATLSRNRLQVTADAYVSNENLLRAFFANRDPQQPILTDNPWVLHAYTDRECLMLPTDGMDAVADVGRKLNVRYLVLPGRGRTAYPGFQQAVDDGQLVPVRAMPTIAKVGGLQIFDLWLLEARRLNEEGTAAARQGEWPQAIESFEAALRRAPDHPAARHAIGKNLARAHLGYGGALEKQGHTADAAREYRAAVEAAPEDVDTSAARARLAALTKPPKRA